MKSHLKRSIIATAVGLIIAVSCRADDASYAGVLKERDSVLSQILTERENKRSSGLGDEEAIMKAQLALYSFRRDVAAAPAEKIKSQELVVRVLDRKFERVKAMVTSGMGDSVSTLDAKAALLEAKQLLEELRLKEKNG